MIDFKKNFLVAVSLYAFALHSSDGKLVNCTRISEGAPVLPQEIMEAAACRGMKISARSSLKSTYPGWWIIQDPSGNDIPVRNPLVQQKEPTCGCLCFVGRCFRKHHTCGKYR